MTPEDIVQLFRDAASGEDDEIPCKPCRGTGRERKNQEFTGLDCAACYGSGIIDE